MDWFQCNIKSKTLNSSWGHFFPAAFAIVTDQEKKIKIKLIKININQTDCIFHFSETKPLNKEANSEYAEPHQDQISENFLA